MQIDWPAWIEALSTFLAFAAAIFAYFQLRRQAKLLKDQLDDQKKLTDAQITGMEAEGRLRRLDQASRVYLVCTTGLHARDFNSEPHEVWIKVQVTNLSDRPIYRVRPQYYMQYLPAGNALIDETELPPREPDNKIVEILGPGQQYLFSAFFDPKATGGELQPELYFAQLTFRDAAGVTWVTNKRGQLRETQDWADMISETFVSIHRTVEVEPTLPDERRTDDTV